VQHHRAANKAMDDGPQGQKRFGNSPPPSEHRFGRVSTELNTDCTSHFTAAEAGPSWSGLRRGRGSGARRPRRVASPPELYDAEQRRRRDASPWTRVQGVLAPCQFAVFVVSLCLVVRCLATGDGVAIATASIVTKTLLLYAIMITGAIWEREVFGRYLFAPAFFWEDVFSILVLFLHSAYLGALATGIVGVRTQLLVALAAYAAYAINATQFVLKFRAARRNRSELASQSQAAVMTGGAP
jgi:3-vinyl bacteriochlorophyllide hydratase